MNSREEREFYQMVAKELYAHLGPRRVKNWYDDVGPLRMRTFVAVEDSGRPVGFAKWEVYDSVVEGVTLDLVALVVDPVWQGQGVGKRLFQESLAAMEKIHRVGLVKIETSTAADFYRKSAPANYRVEEASVSAFSKKVYFFYLVPV